ncbi:MAG: helix-turn-helix transcriptional regulator [Gemmatimonadaceae bacterium]|nr:helix-turn-helix transcriptional regulator [Gemmatimonadaceae bacterium]
MRIRTRKDLGQSMRELRRGLGLTQAQLAEIVGVNRRWVLQVEQAKTSADLQTLLRALGALGAELHLRPERTSAGAAELRDIIDAKPKGGA